MFCERTDRFDLENASAFGSLIKRLEDSFKESENMRRLSGRWDDKKEWMYEEA